MDVPRNLMKTHPQKYFLKIVCRLTYYMGLGDCWYEKTERSKTHKIVYAIWAFIINAYIILNVLNEVLANFRSDLTAKEKNDLIQFSLAHPSLSAKYIFLILQKKRVRVLFKRLVEGGRSTITSLQIEWKSVKEAILYSFAISFIAYGALALTTIDAYIAYKKNGTPFRMEVTLLPSPSYTGSFEPFIRFMIELHWWVIVTNMSFVDGISVFSMVYLGYKYRLICMYFENIRVKTLRNIKTKSEKECAEEFEKDFKTGVELHVDALWCSRNVQYALGNIYGVEIIETFTLLVMCLIKLVSLERNMVFLLANLFYITCLMTLNGAYMMAAGNITYEASRLSDAMFHSGWEKVRMSKKFRSLAVLALQISQKPITMTAFGAIMLSHRNVITVIRSSYSFFAVMY